MKKSILIFLISSFALKINSQTAKPTVDFSEDGGSYFSNIKHYRSVLLLKYLVKTSGILIFPSFI